MLNIGIIGAGIICSRHIVAIETLGNAKITGIADIVLSRAQHFASQCHASAFSDYLEMVDTLQLDAVIINLPHGLHESCALYCARKGIHIFIEKPLANTVYEGNNIVSACKENHVLLQVGHVQSFFPENILAREYILNKTLGELCMINDVRTSYYFHDTRPAWFFDPKLSGGGILMNFGAHSLDKILFLTGSQINSIQGTCTHENQEHSIDGSAQFFLTTTSGVSASVSLCGYHKNNENVTMLYFSHGVLRLSTGKCLELLTDEGFQEICTHNLELTFLNQMRCFLDSVTLQTPPAIDGAYGLAVLSAIEQIHQTSCIKK